MTGSSLTRNLALAGILLGVTVVWGWTFLIVKDAVASYPVLQFLGLRFAVAAVLLAPFVLRRPSWGALRIGVAIGLVVPAAYLFQTVGLTKTTAANAGLLTGLFVIFTPVLDWILFKTRIHRVTAAAITLGFCGTLLLTLTSRGGPNVGDLLEVLTAIAFSLQIVWLGRYARGEPSMQLAFGQMAPAAIVFVLLAGISSQGRPAIPSPWVWFAILLTGAVASALAFWAQTFVQQRMEPSRVALILLGEPAFATLFAVWVGRERLLPVQWLGAALIFGSLVAHESWSSTRRNGPTVTAAGSWPGPAAAETAPE